MAENTTESVRDRTEDEGADALTARIAKKADALKYVILAVFAVLAVVVGIVVYTGNSRAKQRAADADSVFRAFIELRGKTPAEAAPRLAELAKQFAGEPAGVQAAANAFGASIDAGSFAEAERLGNDFLRAYPQSPLVPRFTVAVAQAQLRQGKTRDAIDSLRAFVATATPETLAEGKLALAQALEQFAEEAKDDEGEYTRRLEAAEAEYTDIASRARLATPLQGGFWPQAVTLTADYALVQIKDRLAGHILTEPVPAPAPDMTPATPAELETLGALRPLGETAPASEDIAEAAEEAVEAAADAAEAAGAGAPAAEDAPAAAE